jgi:arylsulfatase A-like enzyme
MSNQPPSLVVVVYDAARAQNFSCYGYRADTTPFLSSLSEKAAVYSNAICSSYWTLPSFASLFTGTYVSRHSLFIDGQSLKAELSTLAEYLSGCGYETAGFCQNPYVSNFTGLDRGFDHFEKHIPRKYDRLFKFIKSFLKSSEHLKNTSEELLQEENKGFREDSPGGLSKKQWLAKCFLDKGASEMNKRAIKWLKNRRRPETPFFLILLYGETHAPYCPPLPYRTKFIRHHRPVSHPLRDINQQRTPFNSGKISMSKEEIAGLMALYDGSIAYSDHCVKTLYKEMNRMGLLDNTIFAVTSDHGDNLGEHGLLSHVHCLYDTLIRIPLIIQWPRDFGMNGNKSYIVQNIDLYPTMVEILGDNKNICTQLEGKSLLSFRPVNKDSFAVSELIKPFGPDTLPYRDRLKKYNRRLVSVRSVDFKYIWSSNGLHEFYNLSDDPHENQNLYTNADKGRNADVLNRLAAFGKPWIERTNAVYEQLKEEIEGRTEREIDGDVKEMLSRLGYF